jgi:hypothetical protein
MDAMMFYRKGFNYEKIYFLDENGFNLESHVDSFLEERIMCIRSCTILSFHAKSLCQYFLGQPAVSILK